jgi:hypothetical protein
MRHGHTADVAAEHICLSPRRFFVLVAEGVIPRAKRQGYNLSAVRRAYLKHLRRSVAEHDETAGSSLTSERAALTRELRESVALKNAVSRGEYAPRDVIRTLLATSFATLRGRALAICKIAPAIEFKARDEVETALRTEVIAALNEMCDPPPVPTKVPRHAGS